MIKQYYLIVRKPNANTMHLQFVINNGLIIKKLYFITAKLYR